VRHIAPPKSQSLLGIHPILSIVCCTDESRSVIEKLRSLRDQKTHKDALAAVVQYCVNSSIYPHAKTVWAFNEPQNEILALKSYLDGENGELESTIRLHGDTYPFIAIEEHHTSEPIRKRRIESAEILANQPRPLVRKDLPSRENQYTYRTTPTILVPTIAISSLYILSKLANED
jgi:hypothetical protein